MVCQKYSKCCMHGQWFGGLCVDTATSTDRIRCWAVRFLDDDTRCCCNSSGHCSICCVAEPNVKKGYVVFSSLP